MRRATGLSCRCSKDDGWTMTCGFLEQQLGCDACVWRGRLAPPSSPPAPPPGPRCHASSRTAGGTRLAAAATHAQRLRRSRADRCSSLSLACSFALGQALGAEIHAASAFARRAADPRGLRAARPSRAPASSPLEPTLGRLVWRYRSGCRRRHDRGLPSRTEPPARWHRFVGNGAEDVYGGAVLVTWQDARSTCRGSRRTARRRARRPSDARSRRSTTCPDAALRAVGLNMR